MVHASLQALLLIVALGSITNIHVLPGGVISDKTIKSNLVMAYQRFLSSKSNMQMALYVSGKLKMEMQRPNDGIVTTLNNLNLEAKKGDCVDWHIDKMVPNSDNYILTDLNPCNATETVNGARKFLRNNRRASITSIGMGNMIHSDWLKGTCGPCAAPFGCLRGINWFRL